MSDNFEMQLSLYKAKQEQKFNDMKASFEKAIFALKQQHRREIDELNDKIDKLTNENEEINESWSKKYNEMEAEYKKVY